MRFQGNVMNIGRENFGLALYGHWLMLAVAHVVFSVLFSVAALHMLIEWGSILVGLDFLLGVIFPPRKRGGGEWLLHYERK